MKRYTVASVPYMNALPLVWGLEEPSSQVEVLYDDPARLPALLEEGQAEAILVSSFDALTRAGRTYVQGLGIASEGPVLSVRLFASKPWSQVKTLALDQSSMTSNALARIVLAEAYGVRPECRAAAPDLQAMLAKFDAAVLIGDRGMAADPGSHHVLDLGAEWTKLTGLPFVWALWVGEASLSQELARLLHQALDEHSQPEVVQKALGRGVPEAVVRRYFEEIMVYRLGPRHIEALELFGRKLVEHDLAPEVFWPRAVTPSKFEPQ